MYLIGKDPFLYEKSTNFNLSTINEHGIALKCDTMFVNCRAKDRSKVTWYS